MLLAERLLEAELAAWVEYMAWRYWSGWRLAAPAVAEVQAVSRMPVILEAGEAGRHLHAASLRGRRRFVDRARMAVLLVVDPGARVDGTTLGAATGRGIERSPSH